MDPTAAVWAMADRLIDERCTDEWLRAQRLLPLVAERRHRRQLPLSDSQRVASRGVAADHAVGEHLLAQVRAAVVGPVLVLKGAEVAACYERKGLRPFADVDVLVGDAEAAAAALRRTGFDGTPSSAHGGGHHHVEPLRREPLRMPVEVHRRVPWVPWCPAPSWGELLAAAEPSRTGVDGLHRPADAHHAVLVAVHAWRSRAYGRMLDLVDVWVLANRADPGCVAAVADAWGIGRLWRASWAAAEAFVEGSRRRPVGSRLLARHLSGRGTPPSPRSDRHAAGLLVTAPVRALPRLARRAPAAVVGRSRVARGPA